MRLAKHLTLFHNKFNKFSDTEACMIDFTYHMTSKLLKNCSFGMKISRFCHLKRSVIMDVNK